MDTETSPRPTVAGVTDTRGASLAVLAGDRTGISDALRHVVPGGIGRVVVAAFQSSI